MADGWTTAVWIDREGRLHVSKNGPDGRQYRDLEYAARAYLGPKLLRPGGSRGAARGAAPFEGKVGTLGLLTDLLPPPDLYFESEPFRVPLWDIRRVWDWLMSPAGPEPDAVVKVRPS